jgi:hypothetical protein
MINYVFRSQIAKITVAALVAGLMSVFGVSSSSAHTAVADGANQTNISLATVTTDASLVVATTNDDDAAAVQSATAVAGTFTTALSLGLISKDATSGTAQTATVRILICSSFYNSSDVRRWRNFFIRCGCRNW